MFLNVMSAYKTLYHIFLQKPTAKKDFGTRLFFGDEVYRESIHKLCDFHKITGGAVFFLEKVSVNLYNIYVKVS